MHANGLPIGRQPFISLGFNGGIPNLLLACALLLIFYVQRPTDRQTECIDNIEWLQEGGGKVVRYLFSPSLSLYGSAAEPLDRSTYTKWTTTRLHYITHCMLIAGDYLSSAPDATIGVQEGCTAGTTFQRLLSPIGIWGQRMTHTTGASIDSSYPLSIECRTQIMKWSD